MTPQTADRATGTDPLLDLLAQCTVRIDLDGKFEGTGFFVAPGEVLTCAHVVHGGRPITVSTVNGVSYSAEPITELLAPDDPQAGSTRSPMPPCCAFKMRLPAMLVCGWKQPTPRSARTSCSLLLSPKARTPRTW